MFLRERMMEDFVQETESLFFLPAVLLKRNYCIACCPLCDSCSIDSASVVRDREVAVL